MPWNDTRHKPPVIHVARPPGVFFEARGLGRTAERLGGRSQTISGGPPVHRVDGTVSLNAPSTASMGWFPSVVRNIGTALALLVRVLM